MAAKAGATLVLAKPYSVSDRVSSVRPFLLPDDLLLTHRAAAPGLSEAREWVRGTTVMPRSGGDSALTRNGLLLPIVRGRGVSIPFIRKRPT